MNKKDNRKALDSHNFTSEGQAAKSLKSTAHRAGAQKGGRSRKNSTLEEWTEEERHAKFREDADMQKAMTKGIDYSSLLLDELKREGNLSILS